MLAISLVALRTWRLHHWDVAQDECGRLEGRHICPRHLRRSRESSRRGRRSREREGCWAWDPGRVRLDRMHSWHVSMMMMVCWQHVWHSSRHSSRHAWHARRVHLVVDDHRRRSSGCSCSRGIRIREGSRAHASIERVVRRPPYSTAARASEHVNSRSSGRGIAVGQWRSRRRRSPAAQPGHGRDLAWPESRAERRCAWHWLASWGERMTRRGRGIVGVPAARAVGALALCKLGARLLPAASTATGDPAWRCSRGPMPCTMSRRRGE